MIIICVSLFSVIIEVEQYWLRAGVCEFDDILTNTFGGVIGMAMGLVRDLKIKGKRIE